MGDWGGGEVPCDLNVVEGAIGSDMHDWPTCFWDGAGVLIKDGMSGGLAWVGV